MSHTPRFKAVRSLAAAVLCIVFIGAGAPGSANAHLAGPDMGPAPIAGSVALTASMSVPRAGHSATLLRTGKVLVAGGMQREGDIEASAELYDPTTDEFSPTGSMVEARVGHIATLLSDGRVLVAGGFGARQLSSAEIYDPATGKFSPTGSMGGARGGHTATLLPNGKVLVAGGDNGDMLATAEIYDPATSRFSPTGSMDSARAAHTATLLRTGKVLVAGGSAGRGSILASAELYDPASGVFARTGTLTSVRHKHAASLLSDDKVLLVGGSDSRDWRGRYASVEVYDPATGKFALAGSMADGRFKLSEATALLPGGKLLVAGAAERVEIYDPASGRFETAEGRLDAARFYSAATLLPDGRALVTGGYDQEIASTANAWLYTDMPASGHAHAQGEARTFPETGKTVRGRFLEYWTQNGGLAQQGYPISEEMQERSDTDGKTYTVQYFERAIFESHPENQAPYDVLLSLLGNFLYKQKYPNGATSQTPNREAGSRPFPETGKRLGGVFLDYWQRNGGLAQQGFPISDEFMEKSDLDGKTYRVQYFERAVFELHPENQSPFNVLLSQLGTFRYRARYGQSSGATATPAPVGQPTATSIPQATPAGGVPEVRLTLREWAIVPNQVEITAGRTRFVVSNDSGGTHNLHVLDASGRALGGTPDFARSGGPKTFELDLRPGAYDMMCILVGHAALGQRGTILVK